MKPLKETPPLKEGSVHIWITDLSTWKIHAPDLRVLLSDNELGRLERLKIKGKAEDFLISRAILRLILALYLGQRPEKLRFSSTPAGKPYLSSPAPAFNISHSGKYFLCGISLLHRIGVDIQEIYPVSSLDRIVGNYFSPAEKAYLISRPENERLELFFAIWTAKEAYLKARGVGFQEPWSGASLIPQTEKPQSFQLDHPGADDDGTPWTVRSLKITSGYRAAYAIPGASKEILTIPFEPGELFSPSGLPSPGSRPAGPPSLDQHRANRGILPGKTG